MSLCTNIIFGKLYFQLRVLWDRFVIVCNEGTVLHAIVPRVLQSFLFHMSLSTRYLKVPTETNLFQWLDGAIRECYFEREKKWETQCENRHALETINHCPQIFVLSIDQTDPEIYISTNYKVTPNFLTIPFH